MMGKTWLVLWGLHTGGWAGHVPSQSQRTLGHSTSYSFARAQLASNGSVSHFYIVLTICCLLVKRTPTSIACLCRWGTSLAHSLRKAAFTAIQFTAGQRRWGWKASLETVQSSPPAQSGVHWSRLPRTMASQVFNISKGRNSTASWGNLLGCASTFTAKQVLSYV